MISTQTDVQCPKNCYIIYQGDSCDDHLTTVRIFLSTLEELRICFGCGSDKGWPDLLSEPMVELVDDVDNSRMPSNSPAAPPLPMQQLFNLMDIRNTTRWCNVAANHEAVLQSTNSQWNNRSHSNFGSKTLQIATKWRG